MPDYGAAAAERDPRAVKASTDLSQVVQALGTELGDNGDGRLVGLCPFHEDGEPSFAVWQWPDGIWACGCWSCGFGPGDLFDFLMRREGLSFGAAIARVGELKQIGMADVEAVATGTREQFASGTWGQILAIASGRKAVKALLEARGVRAPIDWVMREFGVRATGKEVLVPHYDQRQSLVGLKRRWPMDGWVPRAVTGSDLSNLYGAWRVGRGAGRVILCEGESDTWTVSNLYRLERGMVVVGLPAGAGARPQRGWVEWVGRRRLTLLFDADEAGRSANEAWSAAVPHAKVASLPDGTDANTAGEKAVIEAIAGERPWSKVTKVRL